MKSQTQSECLPSEDAPGPVNAPGELFDETLSTLVQSWELDVENIDISGRVLAAIGAEAKTLSPAAEGSRQIPAQFVPYLRDDFSGYPALTAEQEQRLARAVEQGETWGRLVLVSANRRLVTLLAKKYQGRGIEMDELIREGMLGLNEAVDRFDYMRGFRFSTFATHWVREAMDRFIGSRVAQSAMANFSVRHAFEMGIPSIDLTKHRAEPNALGLLTAEFAWKNQVLPIRHETRRLWVAMRDVKDTALTDAVRMSTGCMVQPMVADPAELGKAIAEAYGILEPPQPPSPPTATAVPAPEPAGEMSRLLRETLLEMRGMRDELSSLRREVAELRREHSGTVPRPSTVRLFPFAPPESASHRNR